MQREEVQTGIGRLKVIQDKYGVICNKCCFHCSMAKGKTCPIAKTTFSLNDALPMKFVMTVVVRFCLCN